MSIQKIFVTKFTEGCGVLTYEVNKPWPKSNIGDDIKKIELSRCKRYYVVTSSDKEKYPLKLILDREAFASRDKARQNAISRLKKRLKSIDERKQRLETLLSELE